MSVCRDVSYNRDFPAVYVIRQLADVLDQYVVKCSDMVITKTIVEKLTEISAEAMRKLLENCFPSTDKISATFSEQFTRTLDLLMVISRLPGIKNTFVQTIAPIIFGSILTDPCLNSWCGKQIFSAFNRFIQQSDKLMRHQLVTDNNMIILCQLVDFISVCGEYDYQTVIMECIFRMCQKDMLMKYSKQLIPEDKVLRKAFEAIEKKTYDSDIRTFLNLLNKKYDNIYSVLCDNLFVDDQSLPGPIEYGVTGLWVDFNKKFQSISWYVDRAFLDTPNHELFILPLEAVRSYHLKELDNSVEMFFQLKSKIIISEVIQAKQLNPKRVVLHTKKIDDAKLLGSMIDEYLITSKNKETPSLSGSEWSKKGFCYKISQRNNIKDSRDAFPIQFKVNSLAPDVIEIISDDEEEESLQMKRLFNNCDTNVSNSTVGFKKAAYKPLSVVFSKETSSSAASAKSNCLTDKRKIRQKGVLDKKTIDDDTAVGKIQYKSFNLIAREVEEENEFENQLMKSRSVTPLSHGAESFRINYESEELETEYYTAQMHQSQVLCNKDQNSAKFNLENVFKQSSYPRRAKFVGDSEADQTAIDEIASVQSDIERVKTLEHIKSNITTKVLPNRKVVKKKSSTAKRKQFIASKRKAKTNSLVKKHHWKIKLRSTKKQNQKRVIISSSSSSSDTTNDHTDNISFKSSVIDLTNLQNDTRKASIVVDNTNRDIIEIFDDTTQHVPNQMESETPDGLELKSNIVTNRSDDVQQHNSNFVRIKQTKDNSKSYSSTNVEENLNLQTKTAVINNNKEIQCKEEEGLSQVSTVPLSRNSIKSIDKILNCEDPHLDANNQEISTPLETNVSLQFDVMQNYDADSELLQKQQSLDGDNEREEILVQTENLTLSDRESQTHNNVINDLNGVCPEKDLPQDKHESNQNQTVPNSSKESQGVDSGDNSKIINRTKQASLQDDSQTDNNQASSLCESTEIKETKQGAQEVNSPKQLESIFQEDSHIINKKKDSPQQTPSVVEHTALCYQSLEKDLKNAAKRDARDLVVRITQCDNVVATIRKSVQSSKDSEDEGDLSSPVIINRKITKKRKRRLSSTETKTSSCDSSESNKINKDDSIKKSINVIQSDKDVVLSPVIIMARDKLDEHRIHKQVKDASTECPVEKKKENTSDLVTEHKVHSLKVTEKDSTYFEHSPKTEKKTTTSEHNMSRMPTTCDTVTIEELKADSSRKALEIQEKTQGEGINESLQVQKDDVLNDSEVLNVTKTTTASTRSKRRKMFDPNDLTYMQNLPNFTECDIEPAKDVQIIQKDKNLTEKMNLSKGVKRKSVLESNAPNKFVRTAYEKRGFSSSVKNRILKKKQGRKYQYSYKHFEGIQLTKLVDNKSVNFDLERFTDIVKQMLDEAYKALRDKKRLEVGNKQTKGRQHKKSLHVIKQFRKNQKTSTLPNSISFDQYPTNAQLDDDSIIPENALEIEVPRVPEGKRIKILSNVVLQNKNTTTITNNR